MKTVTAFDLGVFTARNEFVKRATGPTHLVPAGQTTAQQQQTPAPAAPTQTTAQLPAGQTTAQRQTPAPAAPKNIPIFNAKPRMNMAGQEAMHNTTEAANMNWFNKNPSAYGATPDHGINDIYYRSTPGAQMARGGMPTSYTIYGTDNGQQVELGHLKSKPGSMYAPSTNASDLTRAMRAGPYSGRMFPPPAAPTR